MRPIIARFSRLASVAFAVAMAGTVFGQPSGAAPSPKRVSASPADLTKSGRLVLDPFRLESIGLTLYAPAGSHIEATTIGTAGGASAQVLADDGGYVVNIRTHKTTNLATTPAEVAESTMRSWIDAVGVKDGSGQVSPAFANVLLREPKPGQSLTIPNHGQPLEIDRFYLATRQDVKQSSAIRGFTVAKISANQFVTFELITTEAGFPAARPMYEAMVSAAELRDPASINVDRVTAVTAGIKLLESLTAEDYTAILSSPERWERIYKPAASGLDADATEIGYRRIRTQKGPRSLVDGRASGGTVTERQEGFIVQMSARFMQDGRPIDSDSTFFVSPDRKDELWQVRLTDRAQGKPVSMNETGARSERQMTVKVESPGTPGKIVKPSFMPARGVTAGGSESDLFTAYATRVESLLMPQILLRKQLQAEVGVYSYQSDAESIRLRRDLLEHQPDGSWKLTTRLSEDRPPQVSRYDETGNLIRTDASDGTVWQPTTPQRLMEIWKSKGLPVN